MQKAQKLRTRIVRPILTEAQAGAFASPRSCPTKRGAFSVADLARDNVLSSGQLGSELLTPPRLGHQGSWIVFGADLAAPASRRAVFSVSGQVTGRVACAGRVYGEQAVAPDGQRVSSVLAQSYAVLKNVASQRFTHDSHGMGFLALGYSNPINVFCLVLYGNQHHRPSSIEP